MANDVVGLKIGSSKMVAAQVHTNGGRRLTAIASRDVPDGVISRGELLDPATLAAELKTFFKESGLPKKNVRLGLASNRIGVRTIQIEGAQSKEDLTNAVTFRAQEELSIPVMDASLDFDVVDEWTNDEGVEIRRVLVAVAYKDLVDPFDVAFREAGIRLAGMDLEALALLRALAPDIPATGAGEEDVPRTATVIVNVGGDHSVVAITDSRVLEYARVIDWGGSNVTAGLMEGMELDEETAQRYKHALAPGEGIPEGLAEEQVPAAREVIETQVNSFARELISTLQYYQGQEDSLAISHVVLAGGGARLGGFADSLGRLTGVPVHVGDPTTRITEVTVDQEKLEGTTRDPELAVPIGLGLGQ